MHRAPERGRLGVLQQHLPGSDRISAADRLASATQLHAASASAALPLVLPGTYFVPKICDTMSQSLALLGVPSGTHRLLAAPERPIRLEQDFRPRLGKYLLA